MMMVMMMMMMVMMTIMKTALKIVAMAMNIVKQHMSVKTFEHFDDISASTRVDFKMGILSNLWQIMALVLGECGAKRHISGGRYNPGTPCIANYPPPCIYSPQTHAEKLNSCKMFLWLRDSGRVSLKQCKNILKGVFTVLVLQSLSKHTDDWSGSGSTLIYLNRYFVCDATALKVILSTLIS